uniref:Uncharacterized protein n=1 Tax=Arundo donax TaxID=35708 RepID=A0A0A8YLR6_ARUDO
MVVLIVRCFVSFSAWLAIMFLLQERDISVL